MFLSVIQLVSAARKLSHRVALLVGDPDRGTVDGDPGRAVEAVATARQGPHPAAIAGVQLRYPARSSVRDQRSAATTRRPAGCPRTVLQSAPGRYVQAGYALLARRSHRSGDRRAPGRAPRRLPLAPRGPAVPPGRTGRLRRSGLSACRPLPALPCGVAAHEQLDQPRPDRRHHRLQALSGLAEPDQQGADSYVSFVRRASTGRHSRRIVCHALRLSALPRTLGLLVSDRKDPRDDGRAARLL